MAFLCYTIIADKTVGADCTDRKTGPRGYSNCRESVGCADTMEWPIVLVVPIMHGLGSRSPRGGTDPYIANQKEAQGHFSNLTFLELL
jgi:hypothetical protein